MHLSVSHRSPSAIISPTIPAPSSQLGLLGLSKRFVEKIEGSACSYQDIVARYPGMDSTSQTIIKILCENVQTALSLGWATLSDQGIHGIKDALEKNTNLQSLAMGIACLDSNADCPTTFALDMSSALQVNRGLKTLNLEAADSTQAMLANREIFSNLPCFNLASFNFQGYLTPTDAQAIFPKIFSQKFPLANFSWNTGLGGYDPTGSLFSSLSTGIANSSCLKTLDLGSNIANESVTTALFEGIATSRIEQFILPQNKNMVPYAFTKEQMAAILKSVQSNPCFLEAVPTGNPLPADLAAALNNITKTRTPCPPDPACNVPSVACQIPSPPTPKTPFWTGFWGGALIGGVTGVVSAAALTALGMCASKHCRSGETVPLLNQVNIQA
jgi:hypothetical protein